MRKLRAAHSLYTISIIQKEKEVALGIQSPSNIPIEDISLGVRTCNCLKRAGINTVEDLFNFPEERLYKVRNLGPRSIQEILQKKNELIKYFS